MEDYLLMLLLVNVFLIVIIIIIYILDRLADNKDYGCCGYDIDKDLKDGDKNGKQKEV